jgi:hypothetical protein
MGRPSEGTGDSDGTIGSAPRIIPEFYGRSPKELSLRQIVFVADNTYPLLMLIPGYQL